MLVLDPTDRPVATGVCGLWESLDPTVLFYILTVLVRWLLVINKGWYGMLRVRLRGHVRVAGLEMKIENSSVLLIN